MLQFLIHFPVMYVRFLPIFYCDIQSWSESSWANLFGSMSYLLALLSWWVWNDICCGLNFHFPEKWHLFMCFLAVLYSVNGLFYSFAPFLVSWVFLIDLLRILYGFCLHVLCWLCVLQVLSPIMWIVFLTLLMVRRYIINGAL